MAFYALLLLIKPVEPKVTLFGILKLIIVSLQLKRFS